MTPPSEPTVPVALGQPRPDASGPRPPEPGTASPEGPGVPQPNTPDPSLERVLAHLSEAGRVLRRLPDHPIRLRRLRAAVWSAIKDAAEALAAREALLAAKAEQHALPPFPEGLRPGDALRRFGTPTGQSAELLDALGAPVCQAVRSDGRPCQGRPMAGADLCAAHLDATARDHLRRRRLESQHRRRPSADDLGFPFPD